MCGAGMTRRRRGDADAGDHREAGNETGDGQDELAAQHLGVQRTGLAVCAAEQLDDAGLDLLGIVTERARQCDEIVGA